MMELTEIIHQVILEYFSTKEKQHTGQKIAILLEYESLQPDLIWEHIRALSNKYQLHLILGEAWRSVPADLQTLERILLSRDNQLLMMQTVDSCELLYIPNSTYAILAKLALTIDDDLAAWLTIQQQLKGKPILLNKDGLFPTGKDHLSAPPKLLDRILGYQKVLRDEGIHFIQLSEVEDWIKNQSVKPKKRKAILAKHVEERVRAGDKKWFLSADEILTPLAKDRAKELGLQFIREQNQEAKEERT